MSILYLSPIVDGDSASEEPRVGAPIGRPAEANGKPPRCGSHSWNGEGKEEGRRKAFPPSLFLFYFSFFFSFFSNRLSGYISYLPFLCASVCDCNSWYISRPFGCKSPHGNDRCETKNPL